MTRAASSHMAGTGHTRPLLPLRKTVTPVLHRCTRTFCDLLRNFGLLIRTKHALTQDRQTLDRVIAQTGLEAVADPARALKIPGGDQTRAAAERPARPGDPAPALQSRRRGCGAGGRHQRTRIEPGYVRCYNRPDFTGGDFTEWCAAAGEKTVFIELNQFLTSRKRPAGGGAYGSGPPFVSWFSRLAASAA